MKLKAFTTFFLGAFLCFSAQARNIGEDNPNCEVPASGVEKVIDAKNKKDLSSHLEGKALKNLLWDICSNLDTRLDEGVQNVIRSKVLYSMNIISKESDYNEKKFNSSKEQQEIQQGLIFDLMS